MNNVLKINNLTKKFSGNVTALDDVNFSLKKGEILAILGPSGCGKTTLLRTIAGFERPNSGSISINSNIVVGDGKFVPPQKRNVGIIFQDYPLFPNLNVQENISFGISAKENKEEIVKEVLSLVGLSGLEKRYPHELSGGQAQRISLAQIIASSPSFLLLDEPFSNLDAALKKELRVEVRSILKSKNISAILVTHDQQEAFAFADTIAIINNGKIEQIASPADIYHHPKTKFIAKFMGHGAIIDGCLNESCCGISTDIGNIPFTFNIKEQPGCPISLSLRSESIEIAKDGKFSAKVLNKIHAGGYIELELGIVCSKGSLVKVKSKVSSYSDIAEGDTVAFNINPDKVSYIKNSL